MRKRKRRSVLSFPTLRADAEQRCPRAEEQATVGDRWSGNTALAHVVLCQYLQLRSDGQHDDHAVLSGDIDLAVPRDRRREMIARIADALLEPETLARGALEAAADPAALDEKQAAVHQQRRH